MINNGKHTNKELNDCKLVRILFIYLFLFVLLLIVRVAALTVDLLGTHKAYA